MKKYVILIMVKPFLMIIYLLTEIALKITKARLELQPWHFLRLAGLSHLSEAYFLRRVVERQ